MATDEEVAKELHISVDELNNWQGQTKASNIISLEEYIDSGSEARVTAGNTQIFMHPEKVM